MRHLLALVAVVEAGTFSAAAEQLGYTQSAVSQQIATLERAVGEVVVLAALGLLAGCIASRPSLGERMLDGVLAAAHLPTDGWIDPASAAQALAILPTLS